MKKGNHQFNKNLEFSSEKPDFIKRLLGQTEPVQVVVPDREDKDDEKPVVVGMDKGISQDQVDQLLQLKQSSQETSISETNDSKRTNPDQSQPSPEKKSRKLAFASSSKSDSKQTLKDLTRKKAQENTKKIKNKKLLSFGDEM